MLKLEDLDMQWMELRTATAKDGGVVEGVSHAIVLVLLHIRVAGAGDGAVYIPRSRQVLVVMHVGGSVSQWSQGIIVSERWKEAVSLGPAPLLLALLVLALLALNVDVADRWSWLGRS